MIRAEIHQINGIGPVLFERSRRAKHLNISLKPFKNVRVAVPYGVSFRAAKKFALRNKDWITKHQERIKRIEKQQKEAALKFSGTNHREAKAILVGRLEELAEAYGFFYNRVFIRNQKTRWGSCSARNNISLNIKLALLPADLRDYVLLHELTHTRIKNHSPEFWAELDRYVGDARMLRKKLNRCELIS